MAPREPARTGDVTRHYLRLLGGERGAIVLVPVVCGAVMTGVSFYGFEGLAACLWLMMLLPVLQWGIAERPDALDDAMPLDTVRHDLVRVACGGVWAAAALAVAIGFLAVLWYPGYHGGARAALGWYPVLLLDAGLTYYLLGAAACQRGAWRGFLPGAIAAVAFLPFLAPKAQLARGLLLLSLRETPAPGELLAWTAIQAVWTAAAVAVLWLSASAPRLEARAAGGRRGAARAWTRSPDGALQVRAPRPARADTPRRRAPLHRALWREIVILRPLMTGMGAVLLFLTLWVEPTLDAIGANPAGSPWFGPIWSFSVSWPVAVWIQSLHRRRLVEPFPVGAVAQRLIRVIAGAVWLEVAVLLALAGRAASLAGWIPRSPLLTAEAGPWAGIASGGLLLYLLGSVAFLLARENLPAWTLAWPGIMLVVGIPTARRVAPHARLSFESAISAFGPRPGAWAGAMLLWITIFAAVAAGAAAWGVARERAGPSSLLRVLR